jgi:hypothetical protein
MSIFNLNLASFTGKSGGFRLYAWLCFLGVIFLTLFGCTEKSSEIALPEGFSFDGSYYIIQLTRTKDNINYNTYRNPDVTGIMKITNGNYIREIIIYYDSQNMETLQDSGTVTVSDKSITLINQLGRGSDPQGEYDPREDWIRLNYTWDESLLTEIWKRVIPVTNSGL